MSYRIAAGKPLAEEIRRIAVEEIDAAAALLANASNDRQRAVHQARKRLKRLRGLVKLVRVADPAFHAAENARYRDLARSLAPLRDADTLVETADRFLTKSRKKEAAAHFHTVRGHLVARRARIIAAHHDTDFRAILAAFAKAREPMAGFTLPALQEEAAHLLLEGGDDMLRRARKALKRARRRGEAEDFHDLRKAIKYHRMHLSLFEELRPESSARRRSADLLGEKLGELNDIDVLRAALAEEEGGIAGPEPLRAVLKRLAAREKALRKVCLQEAGELLDRRAKFAPRPARAVSAPAPEPVTD